MMSADPNPDRLATAWRRGVSAPDPGPGIEGGRTPEGYRGELLDGLRLILDGRVRDEIGAVLTPEAILERAFARDPGDGWHADTEAGRTPFRPELARRLLALGYLVRPDSPRDDPLLGLDRIDPGCELAGLSLARAVAAVELESSATLLAVVSRHLDAASRGAREGRGEAREWLAPLLADETAQCLLTAGLAGCPSEDRPRIRDLIGCLIDLDESVPEDRDPVGPLDTLIALGRVLRAPGDRALRERLARAESAWPGWRDSTRWPIRHPAQGLRELKARLTERVAEALGLEARKLWRIEDLGRGAVRRWPPLLSFALGPKRPRARATPGGSS